jgi:hypothetical protein
MPVQPSYPGVYIEEIPSNVHTIMGVPTSITAFVGTASCGPDSTAVAIGSMMDYERTFGRVDASPLGVAVSLYYQNGGAQAVIVRITGRNEAAATLTLRGQGGASGPKLAATSKGVWGSNLLARVDYQDRANGKTSYNLTLRDRDSGRTERYAAISTDQTSPRTLARLLKTSALATVVADPLAMPATHADVPRNTDPFSVSTDPATQTPSPPGSPPARGEGDPPPTPTPTPTPTPRPAGGGGGSSGPPPFDRFGFEGDARNAEGPKDPDDYVPDTEDSGIFALTQHDVFFNMLVLVSPSGEDLRPSTLARAAKIAFDKRAFVILDSPRD